MQHYVTHYSLPFTSSSPIRKEQRKNEKSSKNLALLDGTGTWPSQQQQQALPLALLRARRLLLPACRSSPLPHFQLPSPVLHPRRSPVTAATASGGAAASTYASSGGTVSNG